MMLFNRFILPFIKRESSRTDRKYTKKELIRGIDDDITGNLYYSMRVFKEKGRAGFVCENCKRRYFFKYCSRCGSLLSEKMVCTSCGNDIKNNPPFCPECYEPTQIICVTCHQTLPIGDRYCRMCGTLLFRH